MRIIDAHPNQYDYFDFAVPFVVGDDMVFDRRNVVEVTIGFPADSTDQVELSENYYHQIDIHAVGFCGLVYLCFEYFADPQPYILAGKEEPRPRIVYANSAAELEAQTERLSRGQKAKLDRTIALFHKSTKYEALFIENQTPIFFAEFVNYRPGYVARPEKTKKVLREIGFERLFEPTQAYQAIEHYIANVLNNKAAAPIELSNESKLKKAGFDQYSFKHPTKFKS